MENFTVKGQGRGPGPLSTGTEGPRLVCGEHFPQLPAARPPPLPGDLGHPEDSSLSEQAPWPPPQRTDALWKSGRAARARGSKAPGRGCLGGFTRRRGSAFAPLFPGVTIALRRPSENPTVAPAWQCRLQSQGASGARDCRAPNRSVVGVVTHPTQGWRPQGKGAGLARAAQHPRVTWGAPWVWGQAASSGALVLPGPVARRAGECGRVSQAQLSVCRGRRGSDSSAFAPPLGLHGGRDPAVEFHAPSWGGEGHAPRSQGTGRLCRGAQEATSSTRRPLKRALRQHARGAHVRKSQQLSFNANHTILLLLTRKKGGKVQTPRDAGAAAAPGAAGLHAAKPFPRPEGLSVSPLGPSLRPPQWTSRRVASLCPGRTACRSFPRRLL